MCPNVAEVLQAHRRSLVHGRSSLLDCVYQFFQQDAPPTSFSACATFDHISNASVSNVNEARASFE